MSTRLNHPFRWLFLALALASPSLAIAQSSGKQFSNEQLDQLTAQVVRLQDEQAFTMHLLTDGSPRPTPALPPDGEAPPTPNTTTEMP